MSSQSPAVTQDRVALTIEIDRGLRVALSILAARTGRKKKDLVAEAIRRLLDAAPEMTP